MRLIRFLGGKIIGIREDGNIIELIIEKGDKKYRIIINPYIDATYDDCRIDDYECYDLIIKYDIEEVH